MDGSVSIEVRQNGNEIVVAVSGEIDMATAPQLDACLHDHAGTNLTVDLSGVTFLDSSGMSVLVRAHNLAADAGRTFRTKDEHANVRAALKATGLLGPFHGD